MNAPARFWHRYAAWSLDFAAISTTAWFLVQAKVRAGLDAAGVAWHALSNRIGQSLADGMLAGGDTHSIADALANDAALQSAAHAMQDGLEQATYPLVFACTGIALLWHALGEASRWQGSPGKRAFGLVATDIDGNRLGFPRALARQVAGAASWITLNLGHVLAALPPQYRALHDYIAGTRVLRSDDTPRMPLTARLWLLAQLLAGVVALAWGFSRYVAMLSAIG